MGADLLKPVDTFQLQCTHIPSERQALLYADKRLDSVWFCDGLEAPPLTEPLQSILNRF